MSKRPRPDDHLVEPLYSALDAGPEPVAGEQRKGRAGPRRALVVLAILILIVTIWFVTIGA